MRLKTALAQAASVLALCFLQTAAWAQAQMPAAASMAQAATFPKRFEQVWEVVEIMGQPLASQQRPARVALRGQGALLVDGGCNYFSGRFEHDAQGQFRVSKYTGTHGSCEVPPRSEALLNSALVLVNGYRWDNGLVLSSESGDLVRLRPSANQDTQEIEQALARRAPAPAPVPVAEATDCEPVKTKAKAGKSRVVKAGKSHAAKAKVKAQGKSRHPTKTAVCQPAKALKGKAGAAKMVGKSKGKAVPAQMDKGRHRTGKAMSPSRHGGKPAAKAVAKSRGKTQTTRTRKRRH